MSISKDDPVYLNKNEHSPFSLSAVELGFAVLVGVAVWFGLSSFLHSALPYPCGFFINDVSIDCGWTEQQAWEARGKPLFSTYVIPLVLSLAISGVFLVRSIRRDVRHCSIIANLALSFPIFAFIGFFLLSVFSLPCFPLGLTLSIMATINSGKTNSYKWDWISLPFNLAWLVIFGLFINQFLNSYGDEDELQSEAIFTNGLPATKRTACTQLVGVCAFSGSFLSSKPVPSKWRSFVLPTSGYPVKSTRGRLQTVGPRYW